MKYEHRGQSQSHAVGVLVLSSPSVLWRLYTCSVWLSVKVCALSGVGRKT